MSTISLLGFDSTAGNRIPKMPYSSRRLLMKKNPQIRNVDKKITYLNDYHPKNSGAAMTYIAGSKKRPLSLKEALKQQERDSRESLPPRNRILREKSCL